MRALKELLGEEQRRVPDTVGKTSLFVKEIIERYGQGGNYFFDPASLVYLLPVTAEEETKPEDKKEERAREYVIRERENWREMLRERAGGRFVERILKTVRLPGAREILRQQSFKQQLDIRLRMLMGEYEDKEHTWIRELYTGGGVEKLYRDIFLDAGTEDSLRERVTEEQVYREFLTALLESSGLFAPWKELTEESRGEETGEEQNKEETTSLSIERTERILIHRQEQVQSLMELTEKSMRLVEHGRTAEDKALQQTEADVFREVSQRLEKAWIGLRREQLRLENLLTYHRELQSLKEVVVSWQQEADIREEEKLRERMVETIYRIRSQRQTLERLEDIGQFFVQRVAGFPFSRMTAPEAADWGDTRLAAASDKEGPRTYMEALWAEAARLEYLLRVESDERSPAQEGGKHAPVSATAREHILQMSETMQELWRQYRSEIIRERTARERQEELFSLKYESHEVQMQYRTVERLSQEADRLQSLLAEERQTVLQTEIDGPGQRQEKQEFLQRMQTNMFDFYAVLRQMKDTMQVEHEQERERELRELLLLTDGQSERVNSLKTEERTALLVLRELRLLPLMGRMDERSWKNFRKALQMAGEGGRSAEVLQMADEGRGDAVKEASEVALAEAGRLLLSQVSPEEFWRAQSRLLTHRVWKEEERQVIERLERETISRFSADSRAEANLSETLAEDSRTAAFFYRGRDGGRLAEEVIESYLQPEVLQRSVHFHLPEEASYERTVLRQHEILQEVEQLRDRLVMTGEEETGELLHRSESRERTGQTGEQVTFRYHTVTREREQATRRQAEQQESRLRVLQETTERQKKQIMEMEEQQKILTEQLSQTRRDMDRQELHILDRLQDQLRLERMRRGLI